jgi:hypothetical protein
VREFFVWRSLRVPEIKEIIEAKYSLLEIPSIAATWMKAGAKLGRFLAGKINKFYFVKEGIKYRMSN